MPDSAAARRRKFLVVVDKSPECKVAIRFAARRAEHTNGIVTLLTVLGPADFQHWRSVEEAMREEALEEAEKMLHDAARDVNRVAGLFPEYVVLEGKSRECVLKLIKDDPDISILVLASSTAREGPGPLVSSVAQQASLAFPIPVTIVPGGLSDEAVDALA
ncbi:MAG: universal stress protein [Alphaproteobacteria bacterium]|nr:universal stress protein [Alphaproteobacteria bacterium]